MILLIWDQPIDRKDQSLQKIVFEDDSRSTLPTKREEIQQQTSS